MTGGRGFPALSAAFLLAASNAWAEVPCGSLAFTWDVTANTLDIHGNGRCTLTEIRAAAPLAPLQRQDGTWSVGCTLQLSGGAALELHGREAGGDADQVRLRSNNAPGGAVALLASAGTLDLQHTLVTSWDDAVGGPDTETERFGRAYVLARSFLDVDGTAAESRLDIQDSELAYLGADAAEGYGVSWKVNVEDIRDLARVRVWGSALRSRFHHNFRGLYAFGARELTWSSNQVDHNVHVGLNLHDGSDGLVVEGNHVHGNGSHGILASGQCNGVQVLDNLSEANTGHGIMLHAASNDATVTGNRAVDNGQAGLALFDAHRTTVRDNTLAGNLYGLQVSVGASDNLIEDNEVDHSHSYGIYVLPGDAEAAEGDPRPGANRFVHNTLRGGGDTPVRIKDSDGNLFLGNRLARGNGEGFLLSNADGNHFQDNATEEELLFTASGTPRWPSNSTLQGVDAVTVQLTGNARVRVEEPSGRIFRTNDSLPVDVSRDGAILTLTAENTGTKGRAELMDLWIRPSSGQVTVRPLKDREALLAWEGWTDGDAANVHFELGGVSRSGGYSVRKSGRISRPLLVPGADGRLRFQESLDPQTAKFGVFPLGGGCSSAAPGAEALVLAWLLRAGARRRHRGSSTAGGSTGAGGGAGVP